MGALAIFIGKAIAITPEIRRSCCEGVADSQSAAGYPSCPTQFEAKCEPVGRRRHGLETIRTRLPEDGRRGLPLQFEPNPVLREFSGCDIQLRKIWREPAARGERLTPDLIDSRQKDGSNGLVAQGVEGRGTNI
jgi:hypothetical protein